MKQILLLISQIILSVSCVLSQETIYIEANEFGRGIVKPRAAECFAIVPLHIVEESNDIEIIGEKNVKTKGSLIQATANDLAIVRTTNGGELYCEDWKVDGNYDRILENAADGVLKIRQNDGGFKWMQVDIIEVNEANITIEPKKVNKTFSKGMSGSTLFTDVDGEKRCLGMLMEIDSETNEGYVLQIDDILADLQDFFNLEITQQTEKKIAEVKESGESSIKNSKYPIFTKDNLSVQIENCLQTGNKVKCKFLFLNKSKDYFVKLIGRNMWDYTKLYDEKGNEYISNYAKIANVSHSHGAEKTLIADIPMDGEIIFDVSKPIEFISKLQIAWYNRKHDVTYAVWRNVQVDKKE